jgi:hypothetical protein
MPDWLPAVLPLSPALSALPLSTPPPAVQPASRAAPATRVSRRIRRFMSVLLDDYR